MLSAPVKSAKRISSLFSLSNKDQNSPVSPASPNFPSDGSQDRRRRSHSRPTRHVSTPNPGSEPRTIPSPMERFDLDSLPPPPSLTSVNQDLASSAPNTPNGRPSSRGRELARPASSGGLAVPGSAPDSRPSTPSKRRSWMPGAMGARSRASSVDMRRPPPNLPAAWIAGLDQKVVYDLGPLSRGEQVWGKILPRSKQCRQSLTFAADWRVVERAR